MTPQDAKVWIEKAATPEERMRRALNFLAEDSQFTAQITGPVRWGWFTGPGPTDIAKLGLGVK